MKANWIEQAKMKKIRKILIANRGEIVVRIIRTCREMGIGTVAVFSEGDRAAMHVRLADEAYGIGPTPASESYLQQERIIDAALQAGADAIHPGYGFLAENPEFAEKVKAAGLIFIGPPPQAMRLMGDKTAARQTMQAAGVPIVPGTPEPLADAEAARAAAEKVGYPILLKAAAGGGGKGMRVVERAEDIAAAFRAASSEAASAFGDGRVYIEKYLERPRHVEFQIFADHHGNVIHLGERECSIQRRHQKVIEESPSPIVAPEMREAMGAAAVQAARACGYVNAGTIEFLVDAQRNFYFLEMNTRLQVEHPVTEMVTGQDLVEWQIRVAQGEKLPLKQEEVQFHGHAIECRVYAEDPQNQFLPSTGRIVEMQLPDGPGIRVDAGFAAGDEISMYYDPMIAKLIAFAPTRAQAISRMLRALGEYRILGIRTTIPFCMWVLHHPGFRKGEFDTHFVPNEYYGSAQEQTSHLTEAEQHAAAVALAYLSQAGSRPALAEGPGENHAAVSGWRIRGWKRLKRV